MTIEVNDVSKWFGSVVALSEVTCKVEPGITALLGPNGAGKSTLLRVLCGLTAPSRGEVRILGQVPRRDLSLNRRVGLVPQQEALFDPLRAVEFVALAAELHGLPTPGAAAEAALGLVDLDPADRRPVRTYSKGMRQRVKVAQALVHDPEVVLLDEPLEGLDPRQRLRMITLFRGLADEGRTVLISSATSSTRSSGSARGCSSSPRADWPPRATSTASATSWTIAPIACGSAPIRPGRSPRACCRPRR